MIYVKNKDTCAFTTAGVFVKRVFLSNKNEMRKKI